MSSNVAAVIPLLHWLIQHSNFVTRGQRVSQMLLFMLWARGRVYLDQGSPNLLA